MPERPLNFEAAGPALLMVGHLNDFDGINPDRMGMGGD
jgi:hypothetical protein